MGKIKFVASVLTNNSFNVNVKTINMLFITLDFMQFNDIISQ